VQRAGPRLREEDQPQAKHHEDDRQQREKEKHIRPAPQPIKAPMLDRGKDRPANRIGQIPMTQFIACVGPMAGRRPCACPVGPPLTGLSILRTSPAQNIAPQRSDDFEHQHDRKREIWRTQHDSNVRPLPSEGNTLSS
jgi:hypothetical protein